MSPPGPRAVLALVILATFGFAARAAANPTAAFTIAPQGPYHPGAALSFDASPSAAGVAGNVLTYLWRFSDGTSASGRLATHVFSSVGPQNVLLTVTETDSRHQVVGSGSTNRGVNVVAVPLARIFGAYGTAAGAYVSFGGSQSGSTFLCALDDAPEQPCSSPESLLSLAAGSHTVSVREIGAGGDQQATPTMYGIMVGAPDVVTPLVVPTPPQVAVDDVGDDVTDDNGDDTSDDVVATVEPAAAKSRRPAKKSRRPSRRPTVHARRKVITPADVTVGARAHQSSGCHRNHPGNVGHCEWPRITGMFFSTGATRCALCPGTPHVRLTIKGTRTLNDELLGGTADVKLIGYGGNNVLVADHVPHGPRSQHATIIAGNGRNIVYAGPGRNRIRVGTGRNRIHARHGRGTIRCASKRSVVLVTRRSRRHYKIKGCTIKKGQ